MRDVHVGHKLPAMGAVTGNVPLLLSVSEKGNFKKSRRFLPDFEASTAKRPLSKYGRDRWAGNE